MPVEIESPEELGYGAIDCNLAESSFRPGAGGSGSPSSRSSGSTPCSTGTLATYVGPGHWFDQDRRHFRIGFGWPTTAELDRGRANLSDAATRAAG